MDWKSEGKEKKNSWAGLGLGFKRKAKGEVSNDDAK
jgi:hypothetical protein